MHIRTRVNLILTGITLSLLLPSVGSVISAYLFPYSRFPHLPIHSLLEACGGMMAIGVAGILIVEQPRKMQNSHYCWMAAALGGMGVLDLFHAAVMPGNNFVWLHSTATFVGGLVIAFVWLDPRKFGASFSKWLPVAVLISSLLLSILSCIWSEQLPPMLVGEVPERHFTWLAQGLNIGGGIGFLIAGAFFVRRFHKECLPEDWFFSLHTILFGAAGLLFELSALWDAAWWWWHALRMLAYLAAFAIAIRAYWEAELDLVKMNRALNDVNRNLDQTVELRTTELGQERFLLFTLLEHLPDAIYFKDVKGRFLRVSRSLANRFGVSPSEAIGKSDEDFFPPEYALEARADEEELMRSGEPMIGKEESPNWATEDKQIWMSTTKVPLRDATGEIMGTFGLSHDITAQKQTEANFRHVIDAAPNPLVVVNDQGEIEFANAATQLLFGYEREDLIGQPIEILVPERIREGHVELRTEFLANPVARAMGSDLKLAGRRKDGTEFPVELGLNPVEINGRTHVLASVIDVTIRTEAEEALVNAKQAAEYAKQAAENANLAKSDFLANMSHEIRTPMNAIIGMTDLVLDTQLDNSQRGYLTIVSESADSLLSIINQILDFSKIEAGKLELESIDFDLFEEVGDTLKSLGQRAHAKQLELTWHMQPSVPRWVCGDSIRLRQVLVNLVGNAIKFTSVGEVAVEVELMDREPGVHLHFFVRDTGLGIAPDKSEQIFSAFEQADTSTTREFGGTGLGLAISSSIVKALGGRIWVESVEGKGSTFHFSVQFSPGKNNHLPRELPDLEGVSVLVVDDNETNRRIAQEVLQSWGMTVETVASGP